MSLQLVEDVGPNAEMAAPTKGTGCSGTRADRVTRGRPDSLVNLLDAIITAVGAELGVDAKARLVRRLRSATTDASTPDPTISSLCRAYCAFADTYYQRPSGLRVSEPAAIRYAVQPLRRLFGRSPVSQFGPRRLKEVREEMVKQGWCRRQINHQIGRIKRMFKWAVEEERIPASVYHALQAVSGLRAGRTTARESDPVKPVPQHLIDAVVPLVSRQVKAMIELQLLTGMRPGEVCIMRTCDIDQTQQPWAYRPEHHKTEHHRHERIVFLGPRAQITVAPFLKIGQPSAYLFSAAEADRERRQRLNELRKTPLSCGNRPGTNRKRRPKRTPGERYAATSYQRAIYDACRKAFPVPAECDPAQVKQWRRDHSWHAHQLRHNAATKLRKEYGLDVAQVVLGHKTLAVTQVYAEKDTAAAQEAMLSGG